MAERDPGLRLRVLSALVLAPVAVALVVVGGWSFVGLVVAVVALMALEWGRLSTTRFGPWYGRIAGTTALAIGVGACLLAASGQPKAALAVLLIGAALAGLLTGVIGGPGRWIGLGVGYVGLPALALIWLRALPEFGLSMVLWLLLVVWVTDTAAYFAGRRIGGPRLAPAISPGKTWSGLCGGIIGAALAGAGAAWMLDGTRLPQAAGLGAVLAIVAQAGDLVESALKRSAGVKDSGSLIPGHGGVLDRVDGLWFAAPALALAGLVIGPEAWPWR